MDRTVHLFPEVLQTFIFFSAKVCMCACKCIQVPIALFCYFFLLYFRSPVQKSLEDTNARRDLFINSHYPQKLLKMCIYAIFFKYLFKLADLMNHPIFLRKWDLLYSALPPFLLSSSGISKHHCAKLTIQKRWTHFKKQIDFISWGVFSVSFKSKNSPINEHI